MTSSLVGSEMCIRDRRMRERERPRRIHIISESYERCVMHGGMSATCRAPVSYTHLTLPTICSV
eukprot:12683831-Prorocentrum_lima.AAC.1